MTGEAEPDSVAVTDSGLARADSLSSYDVLFLDPLETNKLWLEHLHPQSDGSYRTNPSEDGGLARGLDNLLETRREELLELFNRAGGTVFCKLRGFGRELEVVEKETSRRVTKYSWFPEVSTEPLLTPSKVLRRKGRGDNVNCNKSPIGAFLEKYPEDVRYEAVLGGETSPKKDHLEVYARTESGQIVSFGLFPGKGNLFFLPAGIEVEGEGEGALLKLAHKLAVGEISKRPEWLEKYKLPGESKVSSEISSIRQDIQELEKEVAEKESELDRYREIKSLLFADTDRALRESLKKALTCFGFETKEGEPCIDLALAISDGKNFAIKVSANPSGPVGLEPYHQLVRGIDELKIYENEDPRGLLVANGFAREDPGNRGEEITDELAEGCNLYGFTIITAIEIYERIKQASRTDEAVKESLIRLFEGDRTG